MTTVFTKIDSLFQAEDDLVLDVTIITSEAYYIAGAQIRVAIADLGTNAAQSNAAVIAAVKAYMAADHGNIGGEPSDRHLLMGGF